nr:hypothetical protein [uncultured Brevundimonas sp.]
MVLAALFEPFNGGKPTPPDRASVIAVGSVDLAGVATFADPTLDGLDRVEALLEAGDFDLIAVGRALLANPDGCAKVGAGRLEERISLGKTLVPTLY